MQRLTDLLGTMLELLRTGLRTLRPRESRYWAWRAETAFGVDRDNWPNRRERLGAILRFGRWSYRMKQL